MPVGLDSASELYTVHPIKSNYLYRTKNKQKFIKKKIKHGKALNRLRSQQAKPVGKELTVLALKYFIN